MERKRLQHQVKKQTETSRKAREERRAELEAKLSELRKAIDGVTSQIEALRNVKESESARLAALKGERATLESQAREVEEELDGTAERRRVAEAMDAARAAWSDERERRRDVFRDHAMKGFAKTPAAQKKVEHDKPWACTQQSEWRLQSMPLGQSFPADGAIEWTRFDFKPKVPWKVAPPPMFFSRVESLGAGTELKAREFEPPLPASPMRVRHPDGWKAPKAVSAMAFMKYEPDPKPGVAEMRDAARSRMPDRVRYDPTKDGKPTWQAVKRMEKPFSSPMADTVYLRDKQERHVEALLVKFGLGPGGTGQLQEAIEATGMAGEVD